MEQLECRLVILWRGWGGPYVEWLEIRLDLEPGFLAVWGWRSIKKDMLYARPCPLGVFYNPWVYSKVQADYS